MGPPHVPPRRMRTVRRAMKACLFVCLVLSLVGSVTAHVEHDDMPSDPVDGEMVMSRQFHFDLKNGQRLRFASADTLKTFLHDPKSGLDGVRTAPENSTSHTHEDGVLCPICGMETSSHDSPEVFMKHGDQVVRACSMFHARQLYDGMMLFQDTAMDGSSSSVEGADASKEITKHEFCTGPGTTMLNGFSFSSGGPSPCILLWFPGWVLTTRWRFALACFLVAFSAIFNEYLLHVRRILRKESRREKILRTSGAYNEAATEASQLLRSASQTLPAASSGCCPAWFRTLSPDMQHLIHCGMHGLTIFIAYMLMLVSMTYDWSLFMSTIAGYIVGHFVFGERREAGTDVGQFSFPSN
ncbi:TPA: hypothetical protein N0F65_011547 [Lagenidium giganteum]|uniref:Copper transport protein n=1 Tax=Lagenidium giganteum TaxID=4803 RepID=A0AAV2Z5K6_9STRA|nr:TPA: hypothetical protein N0F65_011547 [Lagenidium giganteum]